jgi:hypothetical protein
LTEAFGSLAAACGAFFFRFRRTIADSYQRGGVRRQDRFAFVIRDWIVVHYLPHEQADWICRRQV